METPEICYTEQAPALWSFVFCLRGCENCGDCGSVLCVLKWAGFLEERGDLAESKPVLQLSYC